MSECEACGADNEYLACRCGDAAEPRQKRRRSRTESALAIETLDRNGILWATSEMQRMKARAEELNAEPEPVVVAIKRVRRSRKAAAA